MGRRKKADIDGAMKQGEYIYINKNASYDGIDGCKYIPRSFFYAKGEGYRIAIFDKLEFDGDNWKLHQIVMNGEEFKKAVGMHEEGRVKIV